MQNNISFDRYAESHRQPKGPGDARPTALQIIEDENLAGKMSDKVILVTGGSSGIGVETVRVLAHTGAHLIVGVRNTSKGQKVLDEMLSNDNSVKQSQFELLEMDFDSLQSVHKAGETFNSKHKQLNVLVNNAGIGGAPQGKTLDGNESHFGVNHLAHFLLFQLLKPTLVTSSTPAFQSRVISVGSSIHRFSPTILADPNFLTTPYNPATAYASSKTANIWFANELERRYSAQGIHAISLHPGGMETGLQAGHDEEFLKMFEEVMKNNPDLPKTFKSIEQGAATTVLAAVGKEFEGKGGLYLDDCQVAPRHYPEKDSIYAPGYAEHAFDEESERKLWETSLNMI